MHITPGAPSNHTPLGVQISIAGRNLPLDHCPHCYVDRPNLMGTGTLFTTKNHLNDNSRDWRNYVCATCGGVVTVACWTGGERIIMIFPDPAILSEAIPERARSYLQQAVGTVASPDASIMVACSSVDAMLKAKGYKDGNLYPRIVEATKDHVLTEGMSKWAHQIRLDANEQRHSDEKAEMASQEDAERIIEFAKALAQFLFVVPALVERGIEEST